MRRTVKVSDVVTATEIAARLGVRVSAIVNWRTRNLGFPEPIYRLNYRWSDVVAWLVVTRRIAGTEDLLQRYPVTQR